MFALHLKRPKQRVSEKPLALLRNVHYSSAWDRIDDVVIIIHGAYHIAQGATGAGCEVDVMMQAEPHRTDGAVPPTAPTVDASLGIDLVKHASPLGVWGADETPLPHLVQALCRHPFNSSRIFWALAATSSSACFTGFRSSTASWIMTSIILSISERPGKLGSLMRFSKRLPLFQSS